MRTSLTKAFPTRPANIPIYSQTLENRIRDDEERFRLSPRSAALSTEMKMRNSSNSSGVVASGLSSSSKKCLEIGTGSGSHGVAMCQMPLLMPSPVVSPGALSFFQL